MIRRFGLMACLTLSVALAGCTSRLGGFADPDPMEPTRPQVGQPMTPGAGVAPQMPPLDQQAPVTLPAMTADGTQQFVVPQSGRSILRSKLNEQVREPIQSAQVSNGWRTAAGAQAHPNDYAACVQASTPSGPRYLLVIISGQAISGYETGAQSAQKCQDGKRVVQWLSFNEAVSGL